MKILVLGSSGQIGVSLVTYLKKNNFDVIEFDIERNHSEDLRVKSSLDEILPLVDFVFIFHRPPKWMRKGKACEGILTPYATQFSCKFARC